ncbi:MAG: BON domain-containing protein [Pyrinomonadaceae bacterium]
MRLLKSFLILSIAIIGFSFVNVEARTLTAPADVPQTEIEQKVFKEILTLPYYGVFDNIQFKVDGSTVTLYGKVYSLGLTKSAERVVKKIDGVDEVVNNIEMLPPSSLDDSIRRQILRSFSRNGGSLYRYLIEPQPSMRIVVDRGRVSLEGYVANRGDYNLANILANGIPGVFSVENNLVINKEPR